MPTWAAIGSIGTTIGTIRNFKAGKTYLAAPTSAAIGTMGTIRP